MTRIATLPHLVQLNEVPVHSKLVVLGSDFELATNESGCGHLSALLVRNNAGAVEVVAGPLAVDPEQHATMGQVLSALLSTVGANMRFYHDGSAQIVYLSDTTPRALFGMHLFASYEFDDEGDHCWQFEAPRSMLEATKLGLFDPVLLPNQRLGRVAYVSGFQRSTIVRADEPVCKVMVVEDRIQGERPRA